MIDFDDTLLTDDEERARDKYKEWRDGSPFDVAKEIILLSITTEMYGFPTKKPNGIAVANLVGKYMSMYNIEQGSAIDRNITINFKQPVDLIIDDLIALKLSGKISTAQYNAVLEGLRVKKDQVLLPELIELSKEAHARIGNQGMSSHEFDVEIESDEVISDEKIETVTAPS